MTILGVFQKKKNMTNLNKTEFLQINNVVEKAV